ncbi:hypothetical protein ACDN41_12470 [Priestia aryabhattai]|uniref:hypothetical protein n=1 Tax=Priestia aryabhattai TaxID=412384 RepID=UPI0035321F84
MAISYYDKKDAKVAIMNSLKEKGWNIFGFKADQSDSMTDYFSPANWDGICEKDGYVLLVDIAKWDLSKSGKEITKKGYKVDHAKVSKLQATINDSAATEAEKQGAQLAIDRMKNKEVESTVVIEKYPTFKNVNPPRASWHIEKNGEIIAKGTGVFSVYEANDKALMNEKVEKLVKRFEKAIKNNSQLVEVEEEVKTVVTKPVEVDYTIEEAIEKEMATYLVIDKELTGGIYKNYVYKFFGARSYGKGIVKYIFLRMDKKLKKTLNGMSNSANYVTFLQSNFNELLEKGCFHLAELKEVEEITYKTVFKKVARKEEVKPMQEESLLESEVLEISSEQVEEVAQVEETTEREELEAELKQVKSDINTHYQTFTRVAASQSGSELQRVTDLHQKEKEIKKQLTEIKLKANNMTAFNHKSLSVNQNDFITNRLAGWKDRDIATPLELHFNDKENTVIIKAQHNQTKRIVCIMIFENGYGKTVRDNELNEDFKMIHNFTESVNEENEAVEVENQTASDVTYKLNEERNGVEIYFTEKPSEEVRELLKVNKFRWSRYNKCWYAKQSDKTIELAKQLSNENQSEQMNNETISYPEINIEDNDSYKVDQQLQDREHDANWIFRKEKKDHNKILEEHFSYYTDKVKAIASTTNDESIIYNLKNSLQRYKKKFHENYVKRMTVLSNNPHWLVTGRAGRSASANNKAMDRYDNLMRESIELTDIIDKALSSAKYKINKVKTDAVKKAVSNISIDGYKFETINKKTGTRNVRMYKLNEYHIVKDWSAYAIFYKGKEVHRMKTTDKLADAKQYVIYLMQNEKDAVTA